MEPHERIFRLDDGKETLGYFYIPGGILGLRSLVEEFLELQINPPTPRIFSNWARYSGRIQPIEEWGVDVKEDEVVHLGYISVQEYLTPAAEKFKVDLRITYEVQVPGDYFEWLVEQKLYEQLEEHPLINRLGAELDPYRIMPEVFGDNLPIGPEEILLDIQKIVEVMNGYLRKENLGFIGSKVVIQEYQECNRGK